MSFPRLRASSPRRRWGDDTEMSTPEYDATGQADDVRRIESAIDEFPRSLAITNQTLELSLWNTLCAHETLVCGDLLRPLPDDVQSPETADSAKNGLKHAVSWLYDSCEALGRFRPPRSLNTKRFVEAAELLQVGVEYHPFETACREYSNGRARAVASNEKTIQFEWNQSELVYDALDRLTFCYNDRMMKPKRVSDHGAVIDSVRKVLRTAMVDADNQLQFDEGEASHELLIASTLSTMTRILPKNWSFEGLSIDLFRSVWAAIHTLCHLHMICHAEMRGYKNPNEYDEGRSVLVIAPEQLLNRICTLSSIAERASVECIVDLLTYDTKVPNADPALQPIVRLGSYFALAPSLVRSSRFERNLMALLARARRSEYDRISGKLAPHMLNELKMSFLEAGLMAEDSINLPISSRLPDIDLAVLDPSSEKVLLIEAKWVILASEVSEFQSRTRREKEGIQQVSKLVEYARSNPSGVLAACFPNYTARGEPDFHGCVCMRGFVGSAENGRLDFPVVEETLLLNKLQSGSGLSTLIRWLETREFLPVEGRDFEVSETVHQVGPYKYFWVGYRLLS